MKYLVFIGFLLSLSVANARGGHQQGQPVWNQGFLNCSVQNYSHYSMWVESVHYTYRCLQPNGFWVNQRFSIPCTNGICGIWPNNSLLFQGPNIQNCLNNVAYQSRCGVRFSWY